LYRDGLVHSLVMIAGAGTQSLTYSIEICGSALHLGEKTVLYKLHNDASRF
jgi:hypothetical protein